MNRTLEFINEYNFFSIDKYIRFLSLDTKENFVKYQINDIEKFVIICRFNNDSFEKIRCKLFLKFKKKYTNKERIRQIEGKALRKILSCVIKLNRATLLTMIRFLELANNGNTWRREEQENYEDIINVINWMKIPIT